MEHRVLKDPVTLLKSKATGYVCLEKKRVEKFVTFYRYM